MIRTSWFIALRENHVPYQLDRGDLNRALIITETWYWSEGSTWHRTRRAATAFRSREEADSVAFAMTTQVPTLIGAVSVERLRHRL